MRYLALICFILISSFLAGCNAGTTYELYGMDAIVLASQEAQKSLIAYDEFARSATQERKEVLYNHLREDLKKIALSNDETPESAKVLADAVVKGFKENLEVIESDDQRRQKNFDTARDNFLYVQEVADRIKSYAVYRSNISEQWKQFIIAQGNELVKERNE